MSEKKRVLIFDTFARLGGGLAYLANIGDALLNKDHRWDWIFYCNPAIKGHINSLEKATEVLYGPEFIKKGGLMGYLHRRSILEKSIENIKPDAVIAMNQLESKIDVPSILFLRNPLYFSIKNPVLRKIFPLKSLIVSSFLRNASLNSIRKADHIVTSTAAFNEQIANDIGSLKTGTSVVPFGLNKSTFSGNAHQYFRNTCEILFLQFNFYKGLDLALNSVKQLIDNGYNVNLTVTDDLKFHKSAAAKKAKNMVETLGLSENVKFIGHKNQQELCSLYDKSDIFWFPSYMESFGHGLLEAMANGLPCVVTDLEVFREIGADCIQYFPMADYKSLASITASLLDNRELCAEMGKKSSIRTNMFSWENHVQKMEHILDNLIEKK